MSAAQRAKATVAAWLLLLVPFGLRVVAAQDGSSSDTWKPSELEIRVQLNVEADGAVAGIIKSHISRYLRSLDGVILTDTNPDYILGVVALKTSSQQGTPTGYVLSSVGRDPMDEFVRTALSTVYENYLATNEGDYMDVNEFLQWFEGMGREVHHLVQVGPSDALEDLCKELVASFDGDVLEVSRRAHQAVVD